MQEASNVVLAVHARPDGPLRRVGQSWRATLALWATRALGAKVSHLAVHEPMLAGRLASHGTKDAAANAATVQAV